MSKIIINSTYYLTTPELTSAPDYVKYLNEKEIYDNTLRLPFPYTLQHALDWIAHQQKELTSTGHQRQWALHTIDNQMIGGIGIDMNEGKSATDNNNSIEIGYWLAKPFWNKGIMTQVVNVFCQYIFSTTQAEIITAHTFAFNIASQRVVEKAGFSRLAYLENFFNKEGQNIDAIKFGLSKQSR